MYCSFKRSKFFSKYDFLYWQNWFSTLIIIRNVFEYEMFLKYHGTLKTVEMTVENSALLSRE